MTDERNRPPHDDPTDDPCPDCDRAPCVCPAELPSATAERHVLCYLRVSHHENVAIVALAEGESRSKANMLLVLVREAMAARAEGAAR